MGCPTVCQRLYISNHLLFSKKTKKVCVVGDWEVLLLCGQLLKVLHLQGCSVALEDADGVWALFRLHAGSGAGLHCGASHHESLVFGLANTGHE